MFNINKYIEINDFIEKSNKNCKIIAISKNHPQESVIKAINLGVRQFGENRVFEAKSKYVDLKKEYSDLKLHLTGPLQSNKVRDALELFDVIHTVDREKIAKEFSKNKELVINKEIFIQVNTGEEKTKSGIIPKHLDDFVNFCRNDMKLNISGLMCIPPINQNPTNHFSMLSELANKNSIKDLSIGMSNDYELAIPFNPKYIRIGTLLFGKRQ
tara:strand:+ start:3181 stop:3819 length:639 start_codon:yes stop_codon:yes gene_type:complete